MTLPKPDSNNDIEMRLARLSEGKQRVGESVIWEALGLYPKNAHLALQEFFGGHNEAVRSCMSASSGHSFRRLAEDTASDVYG